MFRCALFWPFAISRKPLLIQYNTLFFLHVSLSISFQLSLLITLSIKKVKPFLFKMFTTGIFRITGSSFCSSLALKTLFSRLIVSFPIVSHQWELIFITYSDYRCSQDDWVSELHQTFFPQKAGQIEFEEVHDGNKLSSDEDLLPSSGDYKEKLLWYDVLDPAGGMITFDRDLSKPILKEQWK